VLVELVTPPESAGEKEMMIPVDMRGFGEHEFEDGEDLEFVGVDEETGQGGGRRR